MAIPSIDDSEWLELQFHPEQARAKYGIVLPSFPDDATQISFTGMSGRPNLQQAFDFYRFARSVSKIHEVRDPRVMDFGAGWGRIARFFLLRPGGYFIFTTRSKYFITQLEQIKSQSDEVINSHTAAGANGYLQILRRSFPHPVLILTRYDAEDFQFYRVGHAEPPEECTGETMLPRSYFEKHYGSYLADFNDNVVDQRSSC